MNLVDRRHNDGICLGLEAALQGHLVKMGIDHRLARFTWTQAAGESTRFALCDPRGMLFMETSTTDPARTFSLAQSQVVGLLSGWEMPVVQPGVPVETYAFCSTCEQSYTSGTSKCPTCGNLTESNAQRTG